MFRRLVVPLDGSAQSRAALPLARTIARATGGEITLVQVLSGTESRSVVAAELKRIAAELADAQLMIHTIVRQGDPAHEILDVVRGQGADLVVMRTTVGQVSSEQYWAASPSVS
jgi:nucleotide-binding universal stress UspA family protein